MKKPRIRHLFAGLLFTLIGVVIGYEITTRGGAGSATAMFGALKPRSPSDWWVAIGAVANLLLVATAYKGLKSLGLTKKGMLSQATRDGRTCAVERGVEFAETIIPLNSNVLNRLAADRIGVFVKTAEEVRFQQPPPEELEKARAWVQKLPPDLYNDWVAVLNKVEVWAMYFTHGLADDRVAYEPCATLYTSFVIQSYPLLLVLRASNAISGRFPNLVLLYEDWTGKRASDARAEQMAAILRQLQELQSKGTGPGQAVQRSRSLPNVVGMDLD